MKNATFFYIISWLSLCVLPKIPFSAFSLFSPQFARDNNTFLLLLLCSAVYLTAVSLVSPCNTAMDKKSPSLTDKKRQDSVCMTPLLANPSSRKAASIFCLFPLSSFFFFFLAPSLAHYQFSAVRSSNAHSLLPPPPSSYSLAVGLTLGEKKV